MAGVNNEIEGLTQPYSIPTDNTLTRDDIYIPKNLSKKQVEENEFEFKNKINDIIDERIEDPYENKIEQKIIEVLDEKLKFQEPVEPIEDM